MDAKAGEWVQKQAYSTAHTPYPGSLDILQDNANLCGALYWLGRLEGNPHNT